MEWIGENWIWLLLGGAMIAMHLFGHGHGSGHGKEHGGARQRGGGREPGDAESEPPGGADTPRPMTREEHVDPVCGKTVSPDEAKPSLHRGRAYYFCSARCRETFESSPAEYLGRGV